MATPRGAEHRDLEQRLRNLQAQVDRLTNTVLLQRKLEVTSGDFVVHAPGSLKIVDASGNVTWDAEDSPVKVVPYYFTAVGFTIPFGTGGRPIDTTVTTPAGFTRLSFMASAFLMGVNGRASTDFLQLSLAMGDDSAQWSYGPADAGAIANVSSGLAGQTSGLSAGEAVPLQVQCGGSNGSWGSSPNNGAILTALGIWQP